MKYRSRVQGYGLIKMLMTVLIDSHFSAALEVQVQEMVAINFTDLLRACLSISLVERLAQVINRILVQSLSNETFQKNANNNNKM